MKTLLTRSIAPITTNGGTSVAERRTSLLPGAGLAVRLAPGAAGIFGP